MTLAPRPIVRRRGRSQSRAPTGTLGRTSRTRPSSRDRELFTARWLLAAAERPHAGGGVVVAGGRVVEVLQSRRAVARFLRQCPTRVHDLGDCVLTSGLVDAHAHLDLTALAGRLPSRGSFAAWIRALLRQRTALSPGEVAASVRHGADLLLAGGTTCAGDIDSSGASERALRGHPLRARLFREALDAGDPARASSSLARISRPFPRSERRFPGVSPHAPYTVGPSLLEGIGRLSRRRRWPVCVHWAETIEEVEWLSRRSGPFRTLFPRPARAGPRASGLAALEAAGLLTPRTTLVHGNHPSPGDVARVARARAVLVHCPGTHAFFGRDRFDLRGWLDAGVTVALGTDGLSSNADLDIRREMSLLRRAQPWLSPESTLDMATRAGARALGLEGLAGEIAPGAWADFCAHRIGDAGPREWGNPRALLDALTSGCSQVASVWIAGRRVRSAGENPRGISESRGGIAE